MPGNFSNRSSATLTSSATQPSVPENRWQKNRKRLAKMRVLHAIASPLHFTHFSDSLGTSSTGPLSRRNPFPGHNAQNASVAGRLARFACSTIDTDKALSAAFSPDNCFSTRSRSFFYSFTRADTFIVRDPRAQSTEGAGENSSIAKRSPKGSTGGPSSQRWKLDVRRLQPTRQPSPCF